MSGAEAVGLFLAGADATISILSVLISQWSANKKSAKMMISAKACMFSIRRTASLFADILFLTDAQRKIFEKSTDQVNHIGKDLEELQYTFSRLSKARRLLSARDRLQKLEDISARIQSLEQHIEVCGALAVAVESLHNRLDRMELSGYNRTADSISNFSHLHSIDLNPATSPERAFVPSLKLTRRDYRLLEKFGCVGECEIADSLYVIGFRFRLGDGVDCDHRQAARYYHFAANLGCGEASYTLGVMYQYECGIERDVEKSEQYYIRAASIGIIEAMGDLGKWYISGEFGQNRRKEGVRYLKRASSAGLYRARLELALCKILGIGTAIDAAGAFLLLRQAGNELQDFETYRDSTASFFSGMAFYFKNGVPQDLNTPFILVRNNDFFYAAPQWFLSSGWVRNHTAESKVVKYFRAQTEEDLGSFQLTVAHLHQFGYCAVDRNYEIAVYWYKVAAESGNQYAQDYLRLLHPGYRSNAPKFITGVLDDQ